MPIKKKTPHDPAFYTITIVQTAPSPLTPTELRESLKRVIDRHTLSFQYLPHPDDFRHVQSPTMITPPPYQLVWEAEVHPMGHKPKFSRLVGQLTNAHPHFRVSARRGRRNA